jgi:hypothetical protein
MAGSRCLRGGRQITTPRHSVPLHAEVVYVCIGRGATVGVWSIGFGVGVGGGVVASVLRAVGTREMAV